MYFYFHAITEFVLKVLPSRDASASKCQSQTPLYKPEKNKNRIEHTKFCQEQR